MESYHIYPHSIRWGKLNSTQWPHSIEDICEVFLESSWRDVNLKDLSTNLSIWSQCKAVPCNIVTKASILCKSRNRITHSKQRLSENEKNKIFQEINTVITDQNIQYKILSVNSLASELADLKNNKLHSFENEINAILTITSDTNSRVEKLETSVSNIESRQHSNSQVNITSCVCIGMFVAFVSALLVHWPILPGWTLLGDIHHHNHSVIIDSNIGK